MALFEISEDGLVSFHPVRFGGDLYEREIEDLLWANLEEFTGEVLFPVGRQVAIPGGGKPDVVALDESARVVVIEIKREVDRRQLAQCLEYAGWAMKANLDQLARLYDGPEEAFFAAWQEFTQSTAPAVINPSPRLILVAHEFDARTRGAIDFLEAGNLPVRVVPVSMYEDDRGRRFVDVESDHEAPRASTGDSRPRATLGDLLEAGLLLAGDELVWHRKRKGEAHHARVMENGMLELEDGRRYATPSRAAVEAAGIPAYDGWIAWQVARTGTSIGELRRELAAREPRRTFVDDLDVAADDLADPAVMRDAWS